MKTIFLFAVLALAAATAFASTQAKLTQDKPWRVYMLGAAMNTSNNNHTVVNQYYYPDYPQSNLVFTSDSQTTSEKSVVWVNGLGGGGSGTALNNSIAEGFYIPYTNYGNSFENDSIDFDWSGFGNEFKTIHQWGSEWAWEGGNFESHPFDRTNTSNWPGTISDYVSNEHCDVTDPQAHPPFRELGYIEYNLGYVLKQVTQAETYQRHAQAIWHVQTGGKAIPGRQNLWRFNGSAWEILDKRATPPFVSYTGIIKREITNKTAITIGSIGNLKADGYLWAALPDDVDKDITPIVAGKDFYTFGVSGQKHTLVITANTTNLADSTPEFCVGQRVNMQATWSPLLPVGTQTDYNWFASLDFVNGSLNPVTIDGSRYPSIIPTMLTNSLVPMWWSDGGYKYVFCSTTNQFSNGQTITLLGRGNLTIFRPQVKFPIIALQPMVPMLTNGMLKLGESSGGIGAPSFTAKITSITNFPGVANWVQLINRATSPAFKFPSTDGQFWLDNDPLYNTAGVGGANINSIVNPWGVVSFDDNPGISDWLGFESITDSFRTYLVFKPEPEATSIWVTLGVVTWGWSASEGNWLLTGSTVTSPTYTDTNSFPLWLHILHNQ